METDSKGHILIVDDVPEIRRLLEAQLHEFGYSVENAGDGIEAIQKAKCSMPDVILLDIDMPVMDGYQTILALQADSELSSIPVIMMSGNSELDRAVRCIELGAADLLEKPFNFIMLRARVNASSEKRRLLLQMKAEKRRSDELLEAIFPSHVLHELKSTNTVKPRRFDDVAVLMCDIVGFTKYSDTHEPEEVVENLAELVEAFETHAVTYGLEKLNSIGDEFAAVAGMTRTSMNPVLDCIKCGFEMIDTAAFTPARWEVRVGIHYGPVVGGVVGRRKFLYGIWGDTVNVASRAQTYGVVSGVNVTRSAWDLVSDFCEGESRVEKGVKGKGDMEMFRVNKIL